MMSAAYAACVAKLFPLFNWIKSCLSPSGAVEPDIEMQSIEVFSANNQNKENWGKTIATVAFSTALAVLSVYFQIHTPDNVPISFYALCVCIWFSFSFSAASILLNPKNPDIAKINENIGMVFELVTFFFILAIILPYKITFTVATISLLPVLLVSIISTGKRTSADTMVGSGEHSAEASRSNV